MKQLALELAEYPRPIAWTLSEVDRAVGDRDRLGMLFSAFEEISRYLMLVELARYTEHRVEQPGDPAVDKALRGLRRPSFGTLVRVLTTLDAYLAELEGGFSCQLASTCKSPPLVSLLNETGKQPIKTTSLARVLNHIVTLRNREKGHGYPGQLGAKSLVDLLEPCLSRLLDGIPTSLLRTLVWIERIEFIDTRRSIVTLLELMGTQRALRTTQDVREPGALRKGFVYVWDGGSSPLQLTPFLHLEQKPRDEVVYVLSEIGGRPGYQARGSSTSGRHPDMLMTQFQERAPFLIQAPQSVTTARSAAADKLYRAAAKIALADGVITAPEAERLEDFRAEVGLTEEEAVAIHLDLGWTSPAVQVAPAQPTEPLPSNDEQPVAARAVLERIQQHLQADGDDTYSITIDEEVGVRRGELWVEVARTQGVSVWFPRKHGPRLIIAVGFYSTNRRRDGRYREARRAVEANGVPSLLSGWTKWSRESSAGTLALETRKAFVRAGLLDAEAIEEVSTLVSALVVSANQAVTETATATKSEAVGVDASSGDSDFELVPLDGRPRMRGSVWIPRILWALEWGSRHGRGPMSAADIARALAAGDVHVPPTNTARAFRVPSDDPRRAGLCEESQPKHYSITVAGRRELSLLLKSQDE